MSLDLISVYYNDVNYNDVYYNDVYYRSKFRYCICIDISLYVKVIQREQQRQYDIKMIVFLYGVFLYI